MRISGKTSPSAKKAIFHKKLFVLYNKSLNMEIGGEVFIALL
jgi:hypothetical protein